MFVMTIDQQGSRHVGDRVEELLRRLAGAGPLVRAFDRTVGDEVQAVLEDADAVVDIALSVLRGGGWSVGIGVGDVVEPMPTSVRAAQGPAFVAAREAVEAAKSRARSVPVAVRGGAEAADAEAVLVLLGAIRERRTPAGWQAVDAVARSGAATQDEVAAGLGITQQAVSQRLRTALWAEEQAARPVVARLLTAAAGPVAAGH